MSTSNIKSCVLDALLEGMDPDILEAAKQVDRSLSDWLLSLPPLERVRWSLERAAEIARYRRE
jgi:hypothetical protein